MTPYGNKVWSEVSQRRVHLHVKIWEDYYGEVPREENGKRMIIHHINHNPVDNRIENLQLMTASEHAKLHATGRVRTEESKKKLSEKTKGIVNVGKKLSEEHKQKISEGGKGKHLGHFSEEHCKALSNAHKGQIPWNKGKKKENLDGQEYST